MEVPHIYVNTHNLILIEFSLTALVSSRFSYFTVKWISLVVCYSSFSLRFHIHFDAKCGSIVVQGPKPNFKHNNIENWNSSMCKRLYVYLFI